MLQRLLSLLGFVPRLPSMPSSSTVVAPEVQGQTTIRFAAGAKAVASAADDEGERDERRERITDNDLVWPGKTDSIHFRNEEAVAYRFDMTLPGLDPTCYVRRPPIGGVWQSEGGVLLQPGEETSFEVVYVQPPDSVRVRPTIFSYTITGYDPRRVNDPGEIFCDLPLRWVPLPTAADLRLTARPEEVITRPWRRAALFALDLQNRSYLPPSLQLRILRAPTREGLTEEAEKVGNVGQSLESRTSGIWHCLLPAAAQRKSYFATVTGSAKVADNVEFAVGLPQPVFVRYIPWLRVPRDWVFLLCTLFGLFYLVWGIPLPKSPVVYLSLNFKGLTSGQLPDGGSLKDLQVNLTPEVDGLPGNKIAGQPQRGTTYKFTLPGQLYGYHWPFGWNHWSRPTRFTVDANASDDTRSIYSAYGLPSVTTEDNTDEFSLDPGQLPVFSEWALHPVGIVHLKNGILLNLVLESIGAAQTAAAANPIKITCSYAGQPVMNSQEFAIPGGGKGIIKSNIDMGARTSGVVEVKASIGGIVATTWTKTLDPRPEPQEVDIRFPAIAFKTPPAAATAGQPLTLPTAAPAPKEAKGVINGVMVKTQVTPDAVVIQVPASANRPIKVEVRTANGTIPVGTFQVQAPGKPPADLAYQDVLDLKNDDALVQLKRLDPNDPTYPALQTILDYRNEQLPAEQKFDNMKADVERAMLLSAGMSGRKRALALVASGLMTEAQPQPDKTQALQQYKSATDTDPSMVLGWYYYIAMLQEQQGRLMAHDTLLDAVQKGKIRRDEIRSFSLFQGLAKDLGVL